MQITIYGAAHFDKKQDLNERMLGLTIAVVDDKREWAKNAMLNNNGKHIHNQFPDYAYYPSEDRFVKLDNDAAKAEFLGIDEKQFKAWELSIKVRSENELPKLQGGQTATMPESPQPHQQAALKPPSELRIR